MDDSTILLGSSEFDHTTADFLAWFAAANGTRLSSKIQLKDFRAQDAGRSAVAQADIAEDEELFAIPRSLVLTTTTSSIPASLLEPLTEIGAWSPLIVTIIYEYLRREQSPWYPYFRVLPTTFDSLMFWNHQELTELQASAVVNKIGKSSAEESWKTSIIPLMLQHPDLFPLPPVTTEVDKSNQLINLAHMAGSLIMAYAFDIDRDDTNSESDDEARGEDDWEEDDEAAPLKGMVPLADMLNADADRNNAKLYQEPDFLVMKATKPISQGEQIFNDYGPLPRSDLLRMYGYITDNYAQYDVVEVSYDLFIEVAGRKHEKNNTTWLKRERQLD
ncbi:SET domain-containing protein 6 [Exophiala aquamarina CBS 119918]|uniref:SET domain-containing protein 6 n=1 Tax=Exophiala aquamarina CBS 119918 TaxID=1182545 RepID=A0A072PEM7_9EURO|nr:SET domain-containing protein 6 [Exophiala aquamarina CBS 119918]KEF58217.1 SET domain-containing protein 6 [Exophiala aquamarina CBS 119918]